jgi:hypothetical protein
MVMLWQSPSGLPTRMKGTSLPASFPTRRRWASGSSNLRVSDLQIDPARMRVRRQRSDRAFFPSPYRWLLGG